MKDERQNAKSKYEDMLDLPYPYPKSPRHPPMEEKMRAAQFAPFAALTGFEEDVRNMAAKVQEEYKDGYVPDEYEKSNVVEEKDPD